jgi:hypothetical protein
LGAAAGVPALAFRQLKKKYLINGKGYSSLDEVPPEFRKLIEDAPPLTSGIKPAGFIVNNTVYDRFEDIPPEYQAIFAYPFREPIFLN